MRRKIWIGTSDVTRTSHYDGRVSLQPVYSLKERKLPSPSDWMHVISSCRVLATNQPQTDHSHSRLHRRSWNFINVHSKTVKAYPPITHLTPCCHQLGLPHMTLINASWRTYIEIQMQKHSNSIQSVRVQGLLVCSLIVWISFSMLHSSFSTGWLVEFCLNGRKQWHTESNIAQCLHYQYNLVAASCACLLLSFWPWQSALRISDDDVKACRRKKTSSL